MISIYIYGIPVAKKHYTRISGKKAKDNTNRNLPTNQWNQLFSTRVNSRSHYLIRTTGFRADLRIFFP